MMESAQSTLGRLVEEGKKRKGALAELVEMVTEIHEFEVIQDKGESDRMLRLAKASRTGVESSLRDIKGAMAQQRADAAVQDVPLDQLMQLVECANGAYEAMAAQANLLKEMHEQVMKGRWADKPDAQKVNLLDKGIQRALAGLDSRDVKRQRQEFDKIKRAHQAARGGPAPAPGEQEEEEEQAAAVAAAGPDADSDDEFGGADLVGESVRPVLGTRGAPALASA